MHTHDIYIELYAQSMTASGPSSVTSRRRVLIAMAGSLQGVAPAASSASEETAHPERPVYAAQATIKKHPKIE